MRDGTSRNRPHATLLEGKRALCPDAEARPHEALALALRSGRPHRARLAIASDESSLGTVLVRAGRVEEGLALQRDALAVLSARLEADHPLLGRARRNLRASERLAAEGAPEA